MQWVIITYTMTIKVAFNNSTVKHAILGMFIDVMTAFMTIGLCDNYNCYSSVQVIVGDHMLIKAVTGLRLMREMPPLPPFIGTCNLLENTD